MIISVQDSLMHMVGESRLMLSDPPEKLLQHKWLKIFMSQGVRTRCASTLAEYREGVTAGCSQSNMFKKAESAWSVHLSVITGPLSNGRSKNVLMYHLTLGAKQRNGSERKKHAMHACYLSWDEVAAGCAIAGRGSVNLRGSVLLQRWCATLTPGAYVADHIHPLCVIWWKYSLIALASFRRTTHFFQLKCPYLNLVFQWYARKKRRKKWCKELPSYKLLDLKSHSSSN